MKVLETISALSAISAGLVRADSQFRSRPDLSPPRLNITIPARADVAPGYIFVGPYPGFDGVRAGPEQPAAYIFKNNGDMVWSSLGFFAGFVGNFQAMEYQGRPVVQAFEGLLDPFHGHGYGTPVLLDQNYELVAHVRSLNKLISIHEFKIVDEKTALVEIYQPTTIDLRPYGGIDEEWIADGVIQEIDIATGKVLFEAHTLDFADPKDSVIPLRSGRAFTGANSTDAWDYFHVNSVDKDSEGDYLVSGRHMNTIYKISGSDGSVIWQLGGKKSDFALQDGLAFGYQHDARFLSRSSDGAIETISFFDNSARSDRQRNGGVDRLHPHSRAWIVQLNHTEGTATPVQTFIPPDYLSAPSQGNAQVLSSGNVFVNWGQAGAVTEFHADGTPIFHAYLDSGNLAAGVQSYRGFRCEWEGQSPEVPAIVALRSGKETTVYVSWNGDTVTKAWRFSSECTEKMSRHSTSKDSVTVNLLGEVPKTSFETTFTIRSQSLDSPEGGCGFYAEALDGQGEVLSRSNLAKVKLDYKLKTKEATAQGRTQQIQLEL